MYVCCDEFNRLLQVVRPCTDEPRLLSSIGRCGSMCVWGHACACLLMCYSVRVCACYDEVNRLLQVVGPCTDEPRLLSSIGRCGCICVC